MTELNPKNIIEKAAHYWRHFLRSNPRCTLPVVILRMVRTGKFFPSAAWIMAVRSVPLNPMNGV